MTEPFNPWNFLESITLDKEDHFRAVEKNREKIIERFSTYFSDLSILVWTKGGKFENGRYYIPARLYHNGNFAGKITLDNYVVIENENFEGNLRISTLEIFRCHAPNSNNEESFVYLAPIVRLSGDRNNSENTMGYVAIGSTNTINQDELEVLRALTHALALATTEGRYTRRVSAYEELDTLLSQQQSPSQLIESVSEVLRSYCGMSEFCFINFLDFPDLTSHVSQKTLSEFGADEQYEELNDSIIIRNRFKESSGLEYIIIPLLEPAIDIKRHKFQPYSTLANSGQTVNIVNYALGLKRKQRLSYTSTHISNTDGDIASDIGRAFAKLFTASVYETRIAIVGRRIEQISLGGKVNADTVQMLLSGNLLKCNGIAILEENPFDNSDVTHIVGNVTRSDNYFRRMHKFLRENINSENADKRVAIGMDNSDGVRKVEVFIPSRTRNGRIIVFYIDSPKISLVDLQFINSLCTELNVLYKNEDAMRERVQEIAHVRHNIMSTISATSNSIDGFYRLSEIYRDDPELWDQFRSDVAWDDLKMASNFIVTTKLLAENGALLFRDIEEPDISKRQFSMNETLEGVFAQARVMATAANILFVSKISGINITLQSNKGDIFGNKELISLLYVNLIDNAVKYTIGTESYRHYRNEYRLDDRDSSRAVVKAEMRFMEKTYRFSVENVGRHIPEREREMIFKPFRRGRARYGYNKVSGTGIGLPAARLIARAHSANAVVDFTSVRLTDHHSGAGVALNTFFCELPYETTQKRDKGAIESSTY